MNKCKTRQRIIMAVMAVITLGVGIKLALSGFCADEEYAFVEAFRYLKGDYPLFQMWEPHQTSMFLMAFMQWIFYKVNGSLEGVVVFVHFFTLLIHAGVCLYFFAVLRQSRDEFMTFLLSCVIFLTLPKLSMVPDYTMCMVWGMVVSAITIYQMNTAEKWRFYRPLLAGCAVTLMVFAYPTVLPVALLLGVYVIVKSKRKMSDVVLLFLPALIFGGIYLGFAFSHGNFTELIYSLKMILADNSHSASALSKLSMHTECLMETTMYLIWHVAAAIIVVASKAFYDVLQSRQGETRGMLTKNIETYHDLFLFVIAVTVLIRQVYIWIFTDAYPNYPSVEYFLIAVLALFFSLNRWKNSRKELIWYPCLCYICILFASNQNFLVSALFLTVPCAEGLLSAVKSDKIKYRRALSYTFLILWVLTLLFGRTYLIRTNGGMHYTLRQPIACIEHGPAKGLYVTGQYKTEYENVYDEWLKYVPNSKSTLYVSSFGIAYLYSDDLSDTEYRIASPSTISTPTWDDRLFAYWEKNPDRIPEIIVYNQQDPVNLGVVEDLLENEYTLTEAGNTLCIFTRNQ